MRPHTLIVLTLLFALATSPASAFRNVAPGDSPDSPTLIAVDGMVEPLLASYCGAPTVVLFWATWSPRSADALADLQELYAGSGMPVVAVNVDSGSPDGELVAEVARATRTTQFPVVIDRGLNLSGQWGVVAVPSVALVDGAGRVLRTLDGYPPAQRQKFLQEAASLASAAAGDRGSLACNTPDSSHRAY